ncbi:MAG: pyridoxal phosphate-dependent aminotransferase family protein [Cognatishimia sp.]|uniref:aminotransferase class I/II-fold pyridoxal phosphate-dependent enzyme n=1 Tax=Cognatishimia sp. TaxID=2211648 RepID=UPI003B8AC730
MPNENFHAQWRNKSASDFKKLVEGARLEGLLDTARKLRRLDQQADLFAGFEELPLGMVLDATPDPTILKHAGREVINFGTNNYLGTSHQPDVVAAAKQAIDIYGTGATASRLAGGTQSLSLKVEQQISDLYQRPCSMIFSTGFGANASLLGGMGEQFQRIFVDEECHASLYEGVRLSGTQMTRFRHNDVGHLMSRFERYANEEGNWLVVVDGLYSMSGTVAPLKDILALRGIRPFTMMVDEAHSFGTIGCKGLGVAEDCGVLSEVDIITGTFSKALGSIGGFATFKSAEFDLLRFLSVSYVFSAALPPATLAAVSKGLDVSIAQGDELRKDLRARCDQVRQRMLNIYGKHDFMPGPVFSVSVGGPEQTVAIWHHLIEAGFYTNLILPPASPGNAAMLRLGISAKHKQTQIENLLNALEAVCSR